MKDLDEGDSVDSEADCEEVSLVLMLYNTSADSPSPPEIMRAKSVLRRPATDGGPFGFVVEADAAAGEDVAEDVLEATAAPLLLLPAVPLELPLAGAA